MMAMFVNVCDVSSMFDSRHLWDGNFIIKLYTKGPSWGPQVARIHPMLPFLKAVTNRFCLSCF